MSCGVEEHADIASARTRLAAGMTSRTLMTRDVTSLPRALDDIVSTPCRRPVGKSGQSIRHDPCVLPRSVAAMVIAALISGCASPITTSTAPASTDGVVRITVDDLPATSVTVSPTRAAAGDRLVVLAEGASDIVAALGFGAQVVGRGMTGETSLPDVPVVAPAHAVNVEAVLATRPTRVIADAQVAPAAALDQLARAGVDIRFIPVADSFASARERLDAIADLLGMRVDSSAWFPAPRTTADGPRVAFLYLRGTSAIYLVGGQGSGADDVIRAAGGIDVGREQGLGPFTPLTPETLAATDVDVILVMTRGLESVGGIDGLLALPGVAQTQAARERRVIAVDDDVLLSFGPRTPALVDRLADALADLP